MVVVAARRTLIRKRGVSSCPPDYSMEAHGRFRHNNTLNVNQGESFRRTHQVADDHSISGDFEGYSVLVTQSRAKFPLSAIGAYR